MIAIFFFYGLAFFCLGLAVALEARRASDLPLSRQLPWLAAFGLAHALVEWSDMLLLTTLVDPFPQILIITRTVLLPVSAILLIRFGAGMIVEAGPLPKWSWMLPMTLAAPIILLIAYALISATAEPYVAIDVWSRYLLYFSGCLLAGIGFLRQRRNLAGTGLSQARRLMLVAALAFFFSALVAGLIVPSSNYGFSNWLNYNLVLEVTRFPVQFWRMLSATAVTLAVIRALDVFEAERRQRLELLATQRQIALETLRESEERFRTIFEMAPIGMDIVDPTGRPMQANLALQQMLGYSVDELRSKVFNDYTHPDDIDLGNELVRDLAEGRIAHFHLEKRYIRKDGGQIWADTSASAVRDKAGKLLYFIAMVEDITERKRIEELLRLEQEHLQQAELQAQATARESAEGWVNSLVDISRRIANMESIDKVLLFIARETRSLIGSDSASIGLLDQTGSILQLKYQAIRDRAHIFDPPLTMQNQSLLDCLRTNNSFRFPENSHAPENPWTCPTLAGKILSAAAVPLQFDGRLVGGIWLGRFEAHPFTDAELIGLESLADQIVIALQHALMASRLQSLAVLEERSRIAREMHDGLAQILGYLGLEMQTLELLVRQGDQEKTLAELRQAQDNIKTAQADVRENILSLRTTMSGDAGILAALQEYVTEFGLQTGTKSELVLKIPGSPQLSPLAEVQLVRIVQEALTNVRKHARAHQVEVSLQQPNGLLQVTVIDDGIGFEPTDQRHQFGLQTMRERAESVGGKLMIFSAPEKGTKIDLWLPLIVE